MYTRIEIRVCFVWQTVIEIIFWRRFYNLVRACGISSLSLSPKEKRKRYLYHETNLE